jgi:hypothetical protein
MGKNQFFVLPAVVIFVVGGSGIQRSGAQVSRDDGIADVRSKGDPSAKRLDICKGWPPIQRVQLKGRELRSLTRGAGHDHVPPVKDKVSRFLVGKYA